LAKHKSESMVVGSSANRPANEALIWIAPYPVPRRLARLRFRIPWWWGNRSANAGTYRQKDGPSSRRYL